MQFLTSEQVPLLCSQYYDLQIMYSSTHQGRTQQ